MDPLEGGELNVFETTPGPTSTDHLGLVEADDGFSQSVIVRVASAADGRLNTRLGEPLGVRCLRCLLLVMCTYPVAKESLTLYLARGEGHERYFGCNLMHRKVLASSYQHLMAEAPPMLEEGTTIYSYVAIRSDEEYREGYSSKHDSLIVKLPFKEAGIDKSGVLEILDGAGLGLPKYYSWRTRSGCTFCFFQQKIEWVRLKEQHPEAFEEAKAYEKSAVEHGSPFTWSQGESLEELERPERIMQISADHTERLARIGSRLRSNPLRPDSEPLDIDDLYGQAKVCLACHK